VFAAALEPIFAKLQVLFAGAKIVELQTAKPTVIKLASKHAMYQVKKPTSHAVDLIDAFHKSEVLVTTLRTFGKTRQPQARKKGNVVAYPTALTAIGLKISEAINEASFGTAQISTALPTSKSVHGV
jgi:hypothetical protein